MQKIPALSRIFLILSGIFAALVAVVLLSLIEVAAGQSTCVTQINPNISVTPDNLPFGTVFPEQVILKPIKISLSTSCLADKKIQSVSYTITQTSKPKNSKDADYCTAHPTDTKKCYPTLCPYLSETPDGTPPNDTGIAAFHDPATSIAQGLLVANTDKEDNWVIDLHVPCFIGQCAQDNVVPPSYQVDPKLAGSQFGCNLNVVAGTVVNAPPPPPPFKEKQGTPKFWKDYKNTGYSESQINGWLTLINASSTWLMSESGYTVNIAGMTQLMTDGSCLSLATRACAKKNFLANYLAAYLDQASGRKLPSGTYTFANPLTLTYLGLSNPVTLAQALAKTDLKAPDTGTLPTQLSFLELSIAFGGIDSTGI